MMKKRGSIIIRYMVLTLLAFIVGFPILYAITVSTMDSKDIMVGLVKFNPRNLRNFVEVFNTIPLVNYLKNSFVVSILTMVGQLITCTMAAFAFVFIEFKWKKFFFILCICTMMVPWQVTIIPNYLTILQLGFTNSIVGLVLPFLVNALGIFLIRQHFMTIPTELAEAAKIDGCGLFKFYYSMVLPLSKPVLATWSVYSFLQMWNMYLWPLMVTNTDETRTVQIGLKMLQSQEGTNNWGMIMAGVVLVILPSTILLFVGQSYLQEGMMAGATKG